MKTIQEVLTENEDLRKENEYLRREIEILEYQIAMTDEWDEGAPEGFDY